MPSPMACWAGRRVARCLAGSGPRAGWRLLLAASSLGAAAWQRRPCLQPPALTGPRPWQGRQGLSTSARWAAGIADRVLPPVSAADVAEEVAQLSESMVKRLGQRIQTLKRQLRDPAEAEEWLNKGNALNVMPRGKWRQGLTEVEVPDYSQWDADGNPLLIKVALDPLKDFQENAKLCFKKAGKITRASEKVQPLVQDAEERMASWRDEAAAAAAWRDDLAAGSGSAKAEEGVMRLYAALVGEGLIKLPDPPEPPVDPEKEARRAFKRKYGKDIDCFRSPGGHEVVAGRSSEKNEYVSLKLAKGDMVWFHTDNGIPGSHVLIKASWDAVSDEDIEFAAKIAAYHSKGKEKYHVPVMYCKGGDVKKRSGAKKGSVYTTGKRYQIVVTPELPPDEDES